MQIPTPNERDFEIAPAGTHKAICYRVIDLGTQDTSFQGQAKKQHKIMVSWELPDEKMSDGRPFTISQRYTWSMSEKATLRKHLEAWRGVKFVDSDFGPNGFNIKKIVGLGCLLTIIHNERDDKTYANIISISKAMKGMEMPAPSNETAYLWLDRSLWQEDVFQKLSDKLRGDIMKSPEYAAIVNGDEPAKPADDMNDEVPF
jgi:hypothetical protein